MKLHIQNEIFYLESSYEERMTPKEAKFLWHGTRGCYPTCKACRAGIGFKVWWTDKPLNAQRLAKFADEDAQRALTAHTETVASSRAGDTADVEQFHANVPSPEGLDYLPYQRAGIEYGLVRERVLIGDEMGLGKTIQALGIVNADPNAKLVLVVCPASLKINWSREAKKWLVKPFDTYVCKGKADSDKQAELSKLIYDEPGSLIVIINYDILTSWEAALMQHTYDVGIFDEIHYCKNEKTKRTKAALGVFNRKGKRTKEGLAHHAKRLVFLTGTPITNRPVELFPIARAVDPQGLGASFMRYVFRYCDAKQTSFGWDFNGSSNLAELQDKLRHSVMVRRLKIDVLKELPPKRRQIIEMTTNGATAAVNAELRAYEDREQQLQDLEELREAADAAGDKEAFKEAAEGLQEARQVAFEEMARERHATAVRKIPHVLEHVGDFLDSSEGKLLLFAHHKDAVAGLSEGLTKKEVKHVILTGETSMDKRQAAVDQFQNDPETRVFIGNIQAAGVGITLTAADTVIFAELDWTPANMLQAEDRAHRIGQQNSVLVQYLVFEGSVDARMTHTLIKKMEVIEKALDTETPIEEVELKLTPSKARKQYPKATDEQRAVAREIVTCLAGVCDGAVAPDGEGFNAIDTGFGKRLAARAMVQALSDGEVQAVKKMCRKYKRQLGPELMKLWAAEEVLGGNIIKGAWG